ncbi:hypothetical protein BP5796_07892 [Coleophoma crateriformis]|uniref:AAA+ ATPase domain-containing protein n=1 Tax=Coleophoma crateriformis TaxID=565419 RepID=A0A3D8RD56_9HELO|nr:hypothetical protein BP5796_07892 [Coleophoma crateriformis]
MIIPSSNDERARKLAKFFNDVIHERRTLSTSRDGKLFIEAICGQEDGPTCVHRILSSPGGQAALRSSVRFDTSKVFMNDNAVSLLQFLQDPSLESIDSGSVLTQVLLNMVEPPFFWDAFTKSFKEGALTPDAAHCYSWLLLQLVRLPSIQSSQYVRSANSDGILDAILKSSDGKTRILGQKIKHALPLDALQLSQDAEAMPGGRHDNDHTDYRAVSIMPTSDELLSKDRPFFRTADYLDKSDLEPTREALHMDNQFRLLREDMLGDIREEMSALTGSKQGRHRGVILDGLSLADVAMGTTRKRIPWGLVLSCPDTLPVLQNVEKDKRLKFLKNNRHILRQGNLACLFLDGEPAAFPTIYRDENRLAMTPATVVLQFPNDPTLQYALLKIHTASSVKLVQLDSAIFAFEPFLHRLQGMKQISLAEELLHWKEGVDLKAPTFQPTRILQKLQNHPQQDLKKLLSLQKSVVLDDSQMKSLCSSIAQRVSLVQGPPGTGKSFIGALVAKTLHNFTDEVILIVCFTNHALDQFLEDLMDIDIPSSCMVRLGGQSSPRTKPLTLREQTGAKLTASHWSMIDKIKRRLDDLETRLKEAFLRYSSVNLNKSHLMEYLEFLEDDLPFFAALSVPQDPSGMVRVGKRGKAMSQYYLLDRWMRGEQDAGSLQQFQAKDAETVWAMTLDMRKAAITRWQSAILNDLVVEIREGGRDFNTAQAELDRIFEEKDCSIIKSKRIIACTTNGAAKYAAAIQSTSPGVVLVEEAGEILEAHILTALGPHTEQLILIGDHKQLRPKCSYELSVEQGDGFDLNRSLFERLVLKGFPHVTLSQQHRMRPEISSLVRRLTYPDLMDADSTKNRPQLLGFYDNIVFVNHSHREIELKEKEMRDGKTSSKQNEFEGQMILKCVRYLAQQGYGSDKMVVLTPYLGQLKLLREQLSTENDPILNDLDNYDLIRAGLLTDLSSKTMKPQLRISTIVSEPDNYQGEESDIVLVSLTRSNNSRDIGFMAAPERLNVLLSRARNALIMVGDSETFINARKGKELWHKLFDMLKEGDHVYEGFPVRCEKHHTRKAILSRPDDFEIHCPDGGCREPCDVLLSCGIHQCPQSCHQLSDHSKVKCLAVMKKNCPEGHCQSWRCHLGAPPSCRQCKHEQQVAHEIAQKELEEQAARAEKQENHLKAVANINAEIESVNRCLEDMRLSSEQDAVLKQKRNDLAAVQSQRENAKSTKHTNREVNLQKTPRIAASEPVEDKSIAPQTGMKKSIDNAEGMKSEDKPMTGQENSPSKIEWQRQKDQENANNPAIDKIMDMVGLEDVKAQVLRIKAKIETAIRQGTDLKRERLGLVLLGNPGTGKTTVARHYGKVLSSLKALPGSGFIETTGSGLAHGGIAEVEKDLSKLEKSGGGVYFIDEAYQLTEEHNHGGKPVLDFLLTTIENSVGKIVFIFAGYRKEMEKFFEHNPGLPSRIPNTLHFEDYNDQELLSMLQHQMGRFYSRGIKIEEGMDGLYMRVVIRRLGRGRGRPGFGNARALENVFAMIRDRQADRLTKERRAGQLPDDSLLTREDLIGPDPSKALVNCDAWVELQKLTGLKAVKDSVKSMIDLIMTNYLRELQEKSPVELALNRLFLGSPGTGKTTVAKLYGRILCDLGLLTKGEVVIKNPSDFIGAHVGQSEVNTKKILSSTIGKVLVIDEAYMLGPSGETGGHTDSYRTAVIDTIVAEVQNVPGDDRCVLLLGYKPQMEQMFQKTNPGLTRRFQFDDAFYFEDFTDSELKEILRHKLSSQNLDASSGAVSTAIDVLNRARNGLNFGNGGEVENLISKAKKNYQTRQSLLPVAERSIDFKFERQDFDPEYNRASGAKLHLKELFQGVVGCESIVSRLDGFLKVAKGMRAQGLDPRGSIPMNFIFRGPPGEFYSSFRNKKIDELTTATGTGKTTTARKFGQLYYDLGFLAKAEVVECTATNLVGQYVGQTGPKTIQQLERGLGKVLFVDEAYRLGKGPFAKEAISELVDTMTKPQFAGKMVIILAGYDKDMNDLLKANEGLSSRFTDDIYFPPLSPEDCLQLLEAKVQESQISIPSLKDSNVYQNLLDIIAELSTLPSWGNARDIQTLAKSMVRAVYQNTPTRVSQLTLPSQTALQCAQSMLSDHLAREDIPFWQQRPASPDPKQALAQSPQLPPPPPPAKEATNVKALPNNPHHLSTTHPNHTRDAGVSDDEWEELQLAIKQSELDAQRSADELQALERERAAAQAAEEEAAETLAAVSTVRPNGDAQLQLQLQQREQGRIRELLAQRERQRVEEAVEKRKAQERARKEAEERAQEKLRRTGVCVQGFRWVKQLGGYRCAGGSHFVSDAQLEG